MMCCACNGATSSSDFLIRNRLNNKVYHYHCYDKVSKTPLADFIESKIEIINDFKPSPLSVYNW